MKAFLKEEITLPEPQQHFSYTPHQQHPDYVLNNQGSSQSHFHSALFTPTKHSTFQGSPFRPPLGITAANLPSSISSWFCPRISLVGRSSPCHRGFPPRQAASWWGRPSVPGAPRRTRGVSTRPCRGTPCTRRRTPACTAGWRRTSAPAAPRGPRCASWAGPAGSSLEEQAKLSFSLLFVAVSHSSLQCCKVVGVRANLLQRMVMWRLWGEIRSSRG